MKRSGEEGEEEQKSSEERLEKVYLALAGVIPWIGYWLANPKVAGSFQGQGRCLGCSLAPG